jgi:tetrahydromethanopterin S-methyltransferase subunit A
MEFACAVCSDHLGAVCGDILQALHRNGYDVQAIGARAFVAFLKSLESGSDRQDAIDNMISEIARQVCVGCGGDTPCYCRRDD